MMGVITLIRSLQQALNPAHLVSISLTEEHNTALLIESLEIVFRSMTSIFFYLAGTGQYSPQAGDSSAGSDLDIKSHLKRGERILYKYLFLTRILYKYMFLTIFFMIFLPTKSN